ncbi:hypothetical protein M0802_009037 [Mischocyttarus mexicanus]|nr:hypothetical protein M0802_009037 [Mischocyttarus mexicanus]
MYSGVREEWEMGWPDADGKRLGIKTNPYRDLGTRRKIIVQLVSSHKAGLGLLDDPSLEKPADPYDSVKCEKSFVVLGGNVAFVNTSRKAAIHCCSKKKIKVLGLLENERHWWVRKDLEGVWYTLFARKFSHVSATHAARGLGQGLRKLVREGVASSSSSSSSSSVGDYSGGSINSSSS